MTPDDNAADQEDHDAKMAAKATEAGVRINGGDPLEADAPADPAPTPDADAPTKPEGIPDDFWDAEKGEVRVEDLAKAYAALNQAKPADADAEKPAEGDKPDEADADAEPAFADLTKAAEVEFTEKGELSGETYESLEKRGFSREMVDQYIAGAQAQSTALLSQTFEKAGTTSDEYGQAVEWAASSLTEAEIADFNSAVENPAAAPYAVQNLVRRFKSENGYEPGTTVNGSTSPSGTGHFRSKAEMVKAMSDAKYQTDAAYRAEVSQKIANAQRANVNLFS